MSVKPSREKLVSNDPVDVLIIGAGASGAAMAWSLAETRMKILCLEQGEWVNPADYPTTSVAHLAGHCTFVAHSLRRSAAQS